MSYKEKTIWISLLILLYIWGDYGFSLLALIEQQQLTQTNVNSLLKVVIFKTIALEIILNIVLAVISAKDANVDEDERDKQISLRASKYAYVVLSVGVALAIFYTLAPMLNAFLLPDTQLAYHEKIIQIIIIFMVSAEITRMSSQLFFYRRGF
ncbi:MULTISPECIES: hypothetical protein [Thalassotalea]|uniref:hypothetical protein n=1 Tax=Thalassotalea TaxID=1518149 RepID=UPI0009427E9D|nr:MULTISPECIES: hypothetical protein [Thalassotalea]OKY25326.1 hypothetical protein BI291_03040 [Thalassotalea sp. PP2-459]